MSTPEINQVIAQMRVMQAQAGGTAAPADTQANGVAFGDLLQRSIDAVNQTQQESARLKTSFEQGDDSVDIASVMIASQKSKVSFQAMVEVRNKLVEAYKDVMNMPI